MILDNPIIRTSGAGGGIGILRPIINDPRNKYIRVSVREDRKKHRSIYSIDSDVFFETSKGKSDVILNFIDLLSNKLSRDLNRRNRK